MKLNVIREMQIKTTRYYYHPLEWLKLKRKTVLSVGKNVEQLEISYFLVEMQNNIALWKNLAIPYKVKFLLTVWLCNPLGIYTIK